MKGTSPSRASGEVFTASFSGAKMEIPVNINIHIRGSTFGVGVTIFQKQGRFNFKVRRLIQAWRSGMLVSVALSGGAEKNDYTTPWFQVLRSSSERVGISISLSEI